MLTPKQLDRIAGQAAAVFDSLAEAIASDLARRILNADLTLTDTAAWQLERARVLGISQEELLRRISALYPSAEADIGEIFTQAINISAAQDASLYTQAGLIQPGIRDSPALQQLVISGWERTAGTLRNLTQTRAIGPNSLLTATVQEQLGSALDLAHAKITSGAFDYSSAIRRALTELADDGIGAITYPSGHKDTLEVVVRRAVLTGVNQTAGSIGLFNARSMGTDLMELTAHQGARPSHALWQGRVVSLSGRPGYLSLTDIGYGDVTGFQGANCRHSWFPFFEGISEPGYSARELARFAQKALTYKGREMSLYDATQAQRALERRIRRYKTRYIMQQQGALNAQDAATKAACEDAMRKAAVRLADSRKALASFLDETGLKKQQLRETVPGFGRSQAAKAAHDTRTEQRLNTVNEELQQLRHSGIIKAKGRLVLPTNAPEKILFEREHALQRILERGMSFTEALQILERARFALSQQHGALRAYYSDRGFIAIRKDGIVYSLGQLDEGGKKLLEVAKKHGF